jgi:hypothetical protein
MPKKTPKQAARPQARKHLKPEIVAKLGYWLRENRDGQYTSLPLLTLLCNREGYMALSRICARRAREYDRSMRRPTQDDHDHEHLVAASDEFNEFNGRLSDLLELRLVTLFPAKRRVTLGYYGATAAGAKKCYATEMLIDIAKRARKTQNETRASFAEIDARLEAESARRKHAARDRAKKPTNTVAVAGKGASARKGRPVARAESAQMIGGSSRPIRIRTDRRKK